MSDFQRIHPSEDRLFELAHGLATPDAVDELLAHLRRCPQCETRFVAICRTRERTLAEPVPSFERQPAATTGSSSYLRAATQFAAALAAILVLGLGLPWLAERGSTPGDHWLSTELEVHRMRSRPNPAPHGLESALRLYESRDLDPAIDALRRLDLEAGWSDLRDVYLAGALVGAERYSEVESILERLDIPTLPYEYRQAARWYRYRWLTHTGQQSEARLQLESLLTDSGPVGELARRAAADRL